MSSFDEIERVGQDRLLHDLVVAGLADVAIGGQRVGRCPLDAEAGLEQRAVEIAYAAPRRVAVQFARPQQQLARQRRVGQLHRGNRPVERFPLAHGHPAAVPRRARAHEVEVGVVERPPHAEEVGEQQIAVDQPVETCPARCSARAHAVRREWQRADSAIPDAASPTRSPRRRRPRGPPPDRTPSPRGPPRPRASCRRIGEPRRAPRQAPSMVAVPVAADRERHQSGKRAAAEHHGLGLSRAARCAHPRTDATCERAAAGVRALPRARRSRRTSPRRGSRPRSRTPRPPCPRRDRTAQRWWRGPRARPRCPRRSAIHPHHPLPCQLRLGQNDRRAVHFDDRTREGRALAAHKAGVAGELHRRAGAAVQHAHGMDGAVSGMDARQRDPVIAGDLPWNGRYRRGGVHAVTFPDALSAAAACCRHRAGDVATISSNHRNLPCCRRSTTDDGRACRRSSRRPLSSSSASSPSPPPHVPSGCSGRGTTRRWRRAARCGRASPRRGRTPPSGSGDRIRASKCSARTSRATVWDRRRSRCSAVCGPRSSR